MSEAPGDTDTAQAAIPAGEEGRDERAASVDRPENAGDGVASEQPAVEETNEEDGRQRAEEEERPGSDDAALGDEEDAAPHQPNEGDADDEEGHNSGGSHNSGSGAPSHNGDRHSHASNSQRSGPPADELSGEEAQEVAPKRVQNLLAARLVARQLRACTDELRRTLFELMDRNTTWLMEATTASANLLVGGLPQAGGGRSAPPCMNGVSVVTSVSAKPMRGRGDGGGDAGGGLAIAIAEGAHADGGGDSASPTDDQQQQQQPETARSRSVLINGHYLAEHAHAKAVTGGLLVVDGSTNGKPQPYLSAHAMPLPTLAPSRPTTTEPSAPKEFHGGAQHHPSSRLSGLLTLEDHLKRLQGQQLDASAAAAAEVASSYGPSSTQANVAGVAGQHFGQWKFLSGASSKLMAFKQQKILLLLQHPAEAKDASGGGKQPAGRKGGNREVLPMASLRMHTDDGTGTVAHAWALPAAAGIPPGAVGGTLGGTWSSGANPSGNIHLPAPYHRLAGALLCPPRAASPTPTSPRVDDDGLLLIPTATPIQPMAPGRPQQQQQHLLQRSASEVSRVAKRGGVTPGVGAALAAQRAGLSSRGDGGGIGVDKDGMEGWHDHEGSALIGDAIFGTGIRQSGVATPSGSRTVRNKVVQRQPVTARGPNPSTRKLPGALLHLDWPPEPLQLKHV